MNTTTRSEAQALAAVPDLTQLKARWMFVGKAWQDGNPLCDDCSYCRHSFEARPYGEGKAYEAMHDCTLGERVSDKPESCPALQLHLTESEEA